jgi:hypothetical protein
MRRAAGRKRAADEAGTVVRQHLKGVRDLVADLIASVFLLCQIWFFFIKGASN